MKEREDHIETGTVKAKDKKDATEKLRRLDLYKPKLKELKGLSGFIKGFSVDVK